MHGPAAAVNPAALGLPHFVTAVAPLPAPLQLLRTIAGLPQLQHLSLSCLGFYNTLPDDALAELAACRSSSLTLLSLGISRIQDHPAIRWVEQERSSTCAQHCEPLTGAAQPLGGHPHQPLGGAVVATCAFSSKSFLQTTQN